MNDAVISILLVDDDRDDFIITRELLSDIDGTQFKLDWCSNYEDGLKGILEESHDLYLLDYHLGSRTGLELLEAAYDAGIRSPFIMLTGLGDRAVDTRTIKAGAADYLVKGQISTDSLERSIRHARERHAAQEALRLSEERYSIAAQGANDGLWDWNMQNGAVFYSPRWKAQLGYTDKEIGESIEDWFGRVHAADRERLNEALEDHLADPSISFESEHRVMQKNGEHRWMLCRGQAVCDRSGKPYRMAGWQTDSSEHVASYDGLTNLPNRALFLDRLNRALARSKRNPAYQFAVLFMDLDQFKMVNDSLGHGAGDKMLVMAAHRLEETLRATDIIGRVSSLRNKSDLPKGLSPDTVARFGGDEFAVLADDISTSENVIQIAERVLQTLAEPFMVEGHELYTSVSIGIALSGASYQHVDEILRDADIAMYRAKRLGKARYALFDEEMHTQLKARVSLESELRKAIAGEGLRLCYQPIATTGGELTGFEALLRWQREDGSHISPAEFIPMAEESNLIVDLSSWVLDQAIKQASTWCNNFPAFKHLSMSVNISSRHFGHQLLLTDIRSKLDEYQLDGSRLAVEVTEGALLQNEYDTLEELQALQDMGLSVYLDDFGTGYSSLSRLRDLPVNTLKVDRSFVTRMLSDTQSAGIVRTIVQLAKDMQLGVIAEGVETIEELENLMQIGCGHIQGYCFAKPLEAEIASEFLSSGRLADSPLRLPKSEIEFSSFQ